MLKAQPELFRDCLPELVPLLPQHWEKLALNKDVVPLQPAFDTYILRELIGELCFITLRDDGNLVGYWIAFIMVDIHYQTCLTAKMDIWNVIEGYDRGVAPLILLREVEREYKRRKVQRAVAAEKIAKPYSRLLKLFGYEPVETAYSKLMDK